MLGNMTKILGQMQQLQEQLKKLTVEATAGDGTVKIIMNAQQTVLAVRFDPDKAGNIGPEALGQMIIEAFNEAQAASKAKAREEVTKVTGLNLSSLPGLF